MSHPRRPNHSPGLRAVAAAAGWIIASAAGVSSGQRGGAVIVEPGPPVVRSNRFVSPAAEASPLSDDGSTRGPGTRVLVPEDLRKVVELGLVPQRLDDTLRLETQVRRVAAKAAKCAVSVQIGPAQGCGVIVSPGGYVLTAAHVAMRPDKPATITMSDGRSFSGRTLGLNRSVDAGLIRIDGGQIAGDWPYATPGHDVPLIAGMWCLAVGHPGGFDPVRGPVTRLGRILHSEPSSIVTDCALIGGDSGGPLFDLAGRLVAIHSRIGNDVGENLHVPLDNFRRSWDRMVQRESWGVLPGFRPVLGVRGQTIGGRAVVKQINPGSPAETAGVRIGDVVEVFGDHTIGGFEDLRDAVRDTMPGERVYLLVRREDRVLRLPVEIGRGD